MSSLLVRKISTKLASAFAVALFSTTSLAADLYVSTSGNDSNAGTSASAPLRTILKASQLAQPGTVVNVAPGTYTGGFQITKSGTATARITYKSTTKWGARIIPGSRDTIWDQRGSYSDIVGFEVDGNGSTVARYGLYSGGSYITFQNNRVHHVAVNIPCNSGGGSAIGVDAYYKGVRGQVLNNVVHHIGPKGCFYVQGIYISTSAIVKNNLVYNVSEAAIHLWHDANDVQIINNTVAASGTGIIIGGGDFYNSVNKKADYILVHNNIAYDNVYGISERGATGANNKYINNLSFSNTYNWDLDPGKTHSGSILADPQFVAYNTTGTGVDYRLKSTSPALNKGTSSLAPAADLNGIARPQGGAFDIGAYELASSSAPAPSPTPSPTPAPAPPPASAPILSLSASSMAFPNQLVGSTSAVQILTIKNSGTAALKFPSSFVMSGDFAFGGSGTCQVNVNYAPGASCTASVVFKPSAVGTRSGSLSIMSNASSSAKIVPLSGTGLALRTQALQLVNPTLSAAAGSTLYFTTQFNAVKMTKNYSVFVHFVNSSGVQVSAMSVNYVPSVATTQWSGLVKSTRSVIVPSTLPAGKYTIRMGLYDSAGRAQLDAGPGVTVDGSLRYTVGTFTRP